jgi:hypothetical protein
MAMLPEAFILYNPLSKSAKDPFKGFTYVNATKIETTWNLTQSTLHPYSDYTIAKFPTGRQGDAAYYGKLDFMNGVGSTVSLSVYDWSSWFNIHTSPETPAMPVLEVRVNPNTLFTTKLQRNIHLTKIDVIGPDSNVIPPYAGNQTIVNTNIPPPLNQTVAVVPVQNVKKIRPPGLPTLNLFVAKQLLDLAKSRKDQCPVTAEDLIDGHCAAMPCGHLFMQDAIEESFKLKKNECPLCRLAGQPTYL